MDSSYFFMVWNKAFCYEVIRKNSIYFPVDIFYGEDMSFVFRYFVYVMDSINFIHNELYVKCDSHFTETPKAMYLMFITSWQKIFQDVDLWYQHKDKKIYKKAFDNIEQYMINSLICGMVRMEHPKAQIPYKNKRKILIDIVNNRYIRDGVKNYIPQKGNSKWIPRLIKMKAVFLLQIVLKYRSWKRYRGEKTK